jgi:uncharacterized protein (TIGR02246 family)
MSDELAIRALVERYADAVCRRDAEDWGQTWAPGGTWDLGPGREVTGREKIVELWLSLMGGYPTALQLIHSGVVTSIDGDRATARWYLSEYILQADGTRRMGVGVYHDHYVRLDGNWFFARRSYNLLYGGPPDLSGQFLPYQER